MAPSDIVNNDQYNGYRWPDGWDESHVQPLRASDPQKIQQELPTKYSPHPAFGDAAEMAQFAYAAYVRVQENQRRVSQSQPDADVRAPTPLERPVDSRYPNLPSSYEEGWLALERRRQNLPQPEQQHQQSPQQQYQQHYQQPQQHLQYQSQYQTQHQMQYNSQQQQDEQRRQEQEEHQKQQQQRRQIEQEKRIQKQKKRDQQEQQRLEQERQKQKQQQQREQEILQQKQDELCRRQQEQEKQKQQNEEQQRQKLQQEQERGRREEQQRQQIILNAQRRQYERPFGASLSSPTFSHRSDDSRPGRNYTTDSATPPQQFASSTAPMQAPARQMPDSRFLPQMCASANVSTERPLKRHTGTASVEQKKDDYLKSEIRSAGVQNAIARPQSRASIPMPDEQRSLAAPAFSQTSPPSEPYTSASRSTLEPRPQASSTSYTGPGPVAPARAQMTSPNMRLPSLPTIIAPSLLTRANLISDGPKRASLPASLPSITTRQTSTPIPDHLSANRHASHASSQSQTASPVFRSALGSTRLQSSSPAPSEVKAPSKPGQASSIAASLAPHASSQSQPPPSQPSPAPLAIFSPRQYTGPLGQYKYQTSHPAKSDSVSAPAPSPLPKPTTGTTPQLSSSQRLPQAPNSVPSPPPGQSWDSARTAQSGPRFSQAPPSKSRRLNNGIRFQVKQMPRGPVAQTFKAGDYVRKSPSQSHIPLKPDMILPMNNADVLKKFSYDPATIAHDVLINCAKHPTERPLNEHMAAIRNKFPEVDASKDLTTFRWDLVEEAQASLVSQNWGTGAAPPVSAPRGLPPPAPIGAPVPVTKPPATGLPGLPAPAPTTAASQPQTLPANAAALPWIDLHIPRSPNVNNRYNPPRELPFQAPGYHSRASFTNSRKPPGSTPAATPGFTPPNHHQTVEAVYAPPSPHLPHLPPPPNPSPPKQPKQSAKFKPTPTSTPKSTPKSKPKSNSASKPQSTQRTTPSATHPPRPETPRSHSSKAYPEPQVVVPPSPIKMSSDKKRGRPKKIVEVVIPAPEPAVQYPVFRCRWGDCQSELHNLKALESHLMQIHIPYSFICKWQGCSDTSPKAAADMWNHAQDAHMRPVAWKFGDGPKVPVTAEDKPTRFTVPLTRNARPSTMTLPADNSMVVAYNRSHGNQTTELSARAMTDGGIRWLDDVGVTSEASSHRISPVMCQETVNQEEMVVAN